MTTNEDPLGPARGKLLGLAYRMLGSMSDAEDVLQDAYLRYASADRSDVRSQEAFLVTIVTRLCIDRLKSARVKREQYVGAWLPEPVFEADQLSPESALELADDLSFALMLTLERLSASERAAFLLHDVFDVPFSEIASTLGKSEAACRQLASRSRKAVRDGKPVAPASRKQHENLLEGFIKAVQSGDASKIQMVLAEDARALSDGGGIKSAALNPILGADKVARFFAGLAGKAARAGLEVALTPTTINGTPGLVVFVDGVVDHALSLEVLNGQIKTIYVVRNPEKLRLPDTLKIVQ